MNKYLYNSLLILLILLSGCNYDRLESVDIITVETRSQYFKNITPTYKLLDSTLIILTYNVHVGFPRDINAWDSNNKGGSLDHITMLANAIKSVQPDIVALQEVPFNRENTAIPDFIMELANQTEMNYSFGSHARNVPGGTSFSNGMGEWGNGILSKYPIENIENREIDFVSYKERRSVLKADISLSDSVTISVFSAHYRSNAVRTEDYPKSINNTLDFIKESPYQPILCGDFNFFGWDSVFDPINDMMDNAYLIDPDYRDVKDIIFVKKDYFESMEVNRLHPQYFNLSDHEGIYTKIKVK